MLVVVLHLVAVLDRVLDELLDVVEVGVAHRGQLDRRQVEVVLDTVLDPHGHQRIEAQLDQRHLPRQVLGLITHGSADDRSQSVMHRLTGIRRPLGEAGGQIGTGRQVVGQDGRSRSGGDIGPSVVFLMPGGRNRLGHCHTGSHR